MVSWYCTNNMKNKIFILIILGFLIPQITFAVEGTCSYHGGVSCSSGSDWDGSAICNDGWRDSTERFNDTNECFPNRQLCTNSELSSLKTKYNIYEQEIHVQDLNSQLSSLNLQTKLIPYQVSESYKGQGVTDSGIQPIINDKLSENNLKIITVSSQLDTVYSKYISDFNKVKDECYILGDKTYYNNLIEDTKKQNELLYTSQITQIPTVTAVINQTPKCPENAEMVNGVCSCVKGAIFDGSYCTLKKSDPIVVSNNNVVVTKNIVLQQTKKEVTKPKEKVETITENEKPSLLVSTTTETTNISKENTVTSLVENTKETKSFFSKIRDFFRGFFK